MNSIFRDKKKAQTEEMEKLIEDMRAEKQKFAEENARLQAFNTQLQIENASLLKENKEYKQKLGIISQNQTESQEIHIELPMSPDSLPPMSKNIRRSCVGTGSQNYSKQVKNKPKPNRHRFEAKQKTKRRMGASPK